MNDLSDAIKAIILVSMAVGMITFMFILGTILAPIAVGVISIVFVYLIIREIRKENNKKKRR